MCAVGKSSDANEEAGMHCLTIEDWKHARSIVGPSITRSIVGPRFTVSWEDIGGLKDLQKKLQQAVEWPLKHSAAFLRLGVSPVCEFFFIDLQGARNHPCKNCSSCCTSFLFLVEGNSCLGCYQSPSCY